jgi:tRNA 2-selenouridine synthase
MDVPHLPIFIVLCGKTGSGKTQILRQLELFNYPIIDLEKIASHRGSAFGGLLLNTQPSQPDFENEIEKSFLKYNHCKYIFIEQKPSSLGKRRIPVWLYKKIQQGIFIQLDVDKKTRITNILREYKDGGRNGFISSLQKLKERLPVSMMNECEAYLNVENYKAFIETMLSYYDRTDKYSLKKIDIEIKVGDNCALETMNQVMKQLSPWGITFS